MKALSTRGVAPPVAISQAIAAGLAPDGGLYMPDHWPAFSPADFAGDETVHGREPAGGAVHEPAALGDAEREPHVLRGEPHGVCGGLVAGHQLCRIWSRMSRSNSMASTLTTWSSWVEPRTYAR